MNAYDAAAVLVILALVQLLRMIRLARRLNAMRQFYVKRANRPENAGEKYPAIWDDAAHYPMQPEQVLQ